MKDALAETFKGADVSELVPKIIRMAQHILRRQANAVRREEGLDELDENE